MSDIAWVGQAGVNRNAGVDLNAGVGQVLLAAGVMELSFPTNMYVIWGATLFTHLSSYSLKCVANIKQCDHHLI